MMGVLRKVWGAIAQVWVCLVSILSRILQRTKPSPAPPVPPPNPRWREGEGQAEEWDNWDSEEFTVKVVPDGSHGNTDSTHGNGEENEDLFKDMQPVIKKTRKVHLKTATGQESVNLKKFAVDTTFQTGSTELESWSEEGGRGWEEEEEVDLLQTRDALQAQRREERERRRAEMEQLRHQRAHNIGGHLSLGTRVQ